MCMYLNINQSSYSAQILVVNLLFPPNLLVPLASRQRKTCSCCQVRPQFFALGGAEGMVNFGSQVEFWLIMDICFKKT